MSITSNKGWYKNYVEELDPAYSTPHWYSDVLQWPPLSLSTAPWSSDLLALNPPVIAVWGKCAWAILWTPIKALVHKSLTLSLTCSPPAGGGACPQRLLTLWECSLLSLQSVSDTLLLSVHVFCYVPHLTDKHKSNPFPSQGYYIWSSYLVGINKSDKS